MKGVNVKNYCSLVHLYILKAGREILPGSLFILHNRRGVIVLFRGGF